MNEPDRILPRGGLSLRNMRRLAGDTRDDMGLGPDVMLKERLEVIAKWIVLHDAHHLSEEDALASKLESLKDLFGGRDARVQEITPRGKGAICEVSCGNVSLPLLHASHDVRVLLRESFDLNLPDDAPEEAWEKAAVRGYLFLEKKAATGTLTEPEFATWRKISVVVDREKLISRLEKQSPIRAIGQLLKDENGRQTVCWCSDLVLPLSPRALVSLEILEEGEWFEADVYKNAEGCITALENVDIRPDYRLGTEEEIRDFFGHVEE